MRNEYKLWIYSNYFLPSKRFLLTVHNLTDTHLKNWMCLLIDMSRSGQVSLHLQQMRLYILEVARPPQVDLVPARYIFFANVHTFIFLNFYFTRLLINKSSTNIHLKLRIVLNFEEKT